MKSRIIRKIGIVFLLTLIVVILGIIIYALRPTNLVSISVVNDAHIFKHSVSPNGRHIVESLITPRDGVELYRDGTRITNNLYSIEYSPVIGNNGDIAYLMIDKSFGLSKVFYNDEIIFDKTTSCTNLKLVDSTTLGNKLIFASYDRKADKTTVFICKRFLWLNSFNPIISMEHTSVDDIKILPDNHAVVLAECYNPTRTWKVFDIDLNNESFELKTESSERLFLTNENDMPTIDKIDLKSSPNTAYLFNAWYALYHNQFSEPFSYGNDFTGRLSWNESYRIRGMLELYKKTGDKELVDMMQSAARNIMANRNQYIGITADEYNPTFGWSSRKYSLHDEPQCLLVNQCMIMDVLLQVANAGVLDSQLSQNIYDNAKNIFDFYEKDYDGNGHYHYAKGSPFYLDGVILPWNQQNVLANVCLELYSATKDEKYLQRSRELITAFMSEAKEHNDGIAWYYWPEIFFKGWSNEDNISKNTPQYPASKIDDKYEDISHSAINADALIRYADINGNQSILKQQIEKNMEIWITTDGFTDTIGGVGKSSWSLSPNGYWGYFHNKILNEYATMGPHQQGVSFDRSGFLLMSACYYSADESDTPLMVTRYKYKGHGEWEPYESIELASSKIKDFVKLNYMPL